MEHCWGLRDVLDDSESGRTKKCQRCVVDLRSKRIWIPFIVKVK